MAREYAQMKVSIWDDESEFLQLSPNAKLLYMHLFSRRDLSHAGHLFIRSQRWADACFNGSADAVGDAITELIANRYVITDTRTGELLIRTFIRHDGGYRNPKMRKAIQWAVDKVESTELRTLAAELLARCVNGDPDPPSPQVEGQPDYQSEYQSDREPDEVSDSTMHLTPITLHQSTRNSSSSPSDSKSDPCRPQEDEPLEVMSAMATVARKLTERNANGDAFSYRNKVYADQTRWAAIRDLHAEHPTVNGDTLAAMHLGTEQAQTASRVPLYEPPPPYEAPEIPKCEACGRNRALLTATGCPWATGNHPADCLLPGATVHDIRGET